MGGSTEAMLAELAPRVRVLLTPVDASWLNQAEALWTVFSSRYLVRGTWTSRQQMINHIGRSCTESNRCFAHPFEWHWTRCDFRLWLSSMPGLIPCNTCTTDHQSIARAVGLHGYLLTNADNGIHLKLDDGVSG